MIVYHYQRKLSIKKQLGLKLIKCDNLTISMLLSIYDKRIVHVTRQVTVHPPPSYFEQMMEIKDNSPN